MRNEITREFTFREEILPILALCVLLNLSGPSYAAAFGIPLVFMDMSGTAVAAMLLGPWWGAAAGVLSNAFNGAAFSSYFPFGVTNIAGALAWGYAFRTFRERHLLFVSGGTLPARGWLALYGKMLLVSLTTAVPVSAVVKLILYPVQGLPLHYNKPLYLALIERLHEMGIEDADLLALLTGDLFRETLDKGLTVALALVLVAVIKPVPRMYLPGRFTATHVLNKLKTDAESILAFVVTHFIYVLVSRFTVSEIRFSGAPHGAYWLREPAIIALLYAPIVLGVLAFIFLSHDSYSRVGAKIEQARRLRAALYARFRKKPQTALKAWETGWGRRFADLKSIYGVVTLILAWPYRTQLSAYAPLISALLYLGGMTLVFLLFFRETGSYKRKFLRAAAWLGQIHDWQDLRASDGPARSVLKMLGEMFAAQVVPAGRPLDREGLICSVAYAIPTEGPMLSLRSAAANGQIAFFIPPSARTLSAADMKSVQEGIELSRSGTAVLVCASPGLADESALAVFRGLASQPVVMLMPRDLELCVERYVKDEDAAVTLAEGLLRTAEKRLDGHHDSGAWPFGEAPVSELAARALTGVRQAVAQLQPDSLVADLGAGRGRHSLYALARGHRVVAVDRKHEAFEELLLNVARARPTEGHAVVREGDYLQLPASDLRGVELVVITGVLQHAADTAELKARLQFLHDAVRVPGGRIYIEMLFDMRFDGKRPQGRVEISVPDFEQLMQGVFHDHDWCIERVAGPVHSVLDFSKGARSFFPTARIVEQTSGEYLLTHRFKAGT